MEYKFINIGEIFNKYKIINVPYYQRDYVWGRKNLGKNLYKFIDDIFTQYSIDASNDYFIGTLAFCSDRANDVIDGQQRITSIILILSILANTKCSEKINSRHLDLIMPNGENGKFIIEEENYLTEEIKSCLKLKNKFNSQGHKANIFATIDKIKSQIDNAWGGKQTNWYDNLYNYILEKVKLISLEYNNINESLKYFLNINSLSIQLTQSDIFFSILSQAIRISDSSENIFILKEKIINLAEKKGITQSINDYKEAYEPNTDKIEKGIVNIIYIFLSSYYKNDKDISSINQIGVGKWLSFYKNEIFTRELKAKEFVQKFVKYINDFTTIYSYLSNIDIFLDPKYPLYLSFVLLKYENYIDIIEILLIIFKHRHNYISKHNLYDDNNKISEDKLNELGRRLNLVLVRNYLKGSTKRLDGFVKYIEYDFENKKYKISLDEMINDIEIDDMFNLTYNDKKQASNENIKDESRIIKVILGLQEAFLNEVANPDNSLNEYLGDILDNNFSVEHLYSVNEHKNKDRLKKWNDEKDMFKTDAEFDRERFIFKNLSLLNSKTNASCGDDEISEKLKKYKNAKNILNEYPEYLIQSLVDNSDFYKNEKIKLLGLPERKIINIAGNTWDLSPNNRDFNTELLDYVIKRIAQNN